MKKKLITICLAVALFLGLCSFGIANGAYGLISVPQPGLWSPPLQGVAKILQVNVEGSAVTNGTVILSRVARDLSATNTLLTATCVAGTVSDSTTFTNVFLVAGDKLLRAGTATNGTVKIIVAQ